MTLFPSYRTEQYRSATHFNSPPKQHVCGSDYHAQGEFSVAAEFSLAEPRIDEVYDNARSRNGR